MRRVLFSFGPLDVYSYPALLYLGLVVGVYLGYAASRSLGLVGESFLVAELVLLVPALVGARLWFVLAHWPIYRAQPRRILRRSEGGMALYGGLLLSLAVSPAVLGALGLSFRAFWDAATFTMLAGMVFTRIGCLLNGCCAGRPTSRWPSVCLPDDNGAWARRYPTQILEAFLALGLLGTEIVVLHTEPFRGAVLLVAVAGYSAGRVVLEPLRAPRRSESRALSPRVVAALFVVAAVAAFCDLLVAGGVGT